MNKKSDICQLLKAGWHAKAGPLSEGVPQICLCWLIFTFLNVFHQFSTDFTQKSKN